MSARRAAEGSAVPAWGGHGSSVGHFPRTSLRDVLEANQPQHGSERQGSRVPTNWADLLRQADYRQRDTEQRKAEHSTARQQPVADKKPEKAVDPLMLEAHKSKPDSLRGQIRCLGCGKVCVDYSSLAQHLKDKHRGINDPNAPSGSGQGSSSARSGFTLGDVMVISRSKKAASKPPPGCMGSISLTAKQLRNVRGLAKAYPTRDELAQAIKGKLGSSSGKKKLSRLKSVILRERTDKAAAAAARVVEAAAAAAEKAAQAKQAVIESLQAAEARLKDGRSAGARPDTSLITQIQVLEMAMAEADRRLQEALRKAKEADVDLKKATEERSKAWKVPIADKEDAEEDQAAVQVADSVSAHDSPPGAASPDPAAMSPKKSKVDAVAGRDKQAGKEDRAHRRLHAHGERVVVDLGIQEDDTDSLVGLQGFENVLASWVHEANERSLEALASAAVEEEDEGDDNVALSHDSQDDETSGSDSDLDGMGPDGWDDVLSAWMNNAGVLSQQRTAAQPQAASPQLPILNTQDARAPSPRPPLPATSPRPVLLTADPAPSPRTVASSGSPYSSGATTPHAGFPRTAANLPTVAENAVSTSTVSPHSSGRNTPYSWNGAALSRMMSEGGHLSPGPSAISRQGSIGLEGYPSPGTSGNASRQGSLGRDFLSEGYMSPGNATASQRVGMLSREGSLGGEAFNEGHLSPNGNGQRVGLSRHSSIDARSWMSNPRSSAARDPMPLLADVLAGRGLSHDALLDLRVSLEDSASVGSEDSQAASLFTGQVGSSAALSARLQLRHSDGGAPLLGSPSPAQQSTSWEPWRISEQGTRWQDTLGNNPPRRLPNLQSSSHSLPVPPAFRGGGGGAVRMGKGAADREAVPIDLFSRAASVGAMADLGLLRHTDMEVPQVPKLNLNVLTAEQQRMLDGLPALPSPQVRPGEPPLARLPSITRPTSTTPVTQSPGLHSVNSGLGSLANSSGIGSLANSLAVGSGTVPAWLAAVSSDDEAEQQDSPQVPASLSSNSHSGIRPRRASSLPPSQPEAYSQPKGNLHQGSPQTHSLHGPPGSLPQNFPRSGVLPFQRHSYSQQSTYAPTHAMDFRPDFFPDYVPGWQEPNPFQDAAQIFTDLNGGFNGLQHNLHPPHNVPPVHLGSLGDGMGQGFDPNMGSPLDPTMLGMLPPTPQGFGAQLGMSGGNSAGIMAGFESLLQAQGLHHAMFGDFGDMGGSGAEGQRYDSGLRMSQPGGSTAVHEYRCEVCRVTCCGLSNFEQHCVSKKHLRKAAVAGAAAVPDSPPSGEAEDGGDEAAEGLQAANPTYVGLQAHCRTYCKQVISTDLNRVVVELLQHLLFWQERSKSVNPHNAAKKKRLVSGLREVAKAIKLGKAKTVIVTPNIEQIETEGGLDDLLSSILEQAQQTGTPIVFALSRKKLGQVFGCRKKMSAIAILDYSGAEGLFKEMGQLAAQGRDDWQEHNPEDTGEAQDELTGDSANSSTEVMYRLRADGRRVPVTDADAAAAIVERAGRQNNPSSTQQHKELDRVGPNSSGRLHADDSADDSATAALTLPPGGSQIGGSQREGSATDLVEASAVASAAANGNPLSEGMQVSDSGPRAMISADTRETGRGEVSFKTHSLEAGLASPDSSRHLETPPELQATKAHIPAHKPAQSPVQLQASPGESGSAALPKGNSDPASASQIPDALLNGPRSPVPNTSHQGSNASAKWPALRDGMAGQHSPGDRQNVRGGMLREGFPRNAQEGYGPSERLGGGVYSGQQRSHNRSVDYGGPSARRDGSARTLNVQAPQFVPRG